MRRIRTLLLVLALLVPASLPAQDPQSRALATSLGGLAGMAAGGYLTVSVVVLEARFGRYIHDVDDVLGWRAAPLLIGSVAGAGLGLYSPERLQGAVIYGAAGLGLGALAGLALGSQIWEPPEGRWAGAAIGAGFGLIIGNTIGIFNPVNIFTDPDGGTPVETTGVPIVFRIPL
ncbi:MAG TPA: glycine zipper 2TM domain-containing protein [Longimicrobiales bacterium]|nr:glycine zipper 2TM domain-containing protein [Longimicrobiales bacterium]